MKRLLTILLAIMVSLSIIACGNKNGETTKNDANKNQQEENLKGKPIRSELYDLSDAKIADIS